MYALFSITRPTPHRLCLIHYSYKIFSLCFLESIMGKSYANFMCKKFFHPASYDNIKRVWMAQQRTDSEKEKEDALRAEYERDQETYENRQLMGDEKVKHGLSFMYEPPKGFKTEEKEDGKEYKFEWQRVAPREGYAKDMDVTDQPFGIAVRNVKCIRCHNWGHINTDRECPLFNNNKDNSITGPSTDKAELLEDMKKDGLILKQNVMERKVDCGAKNEQIIPSDDDDGVPEAAFLKSLSTKEKKKLLKKLNDMAKPNDLRKSEKKKAKKKKRRQELTEDNSSESSDSEDDKKLKRKKGKEKKKHQSTDESDSESSGNERSKGKKMKKINMVRKYSESVEDGSSDGGGHRRGDERRQERRNEGYNRSARMRDGHGSEKRSRTERRGSEVIDFKQTIQMHRRNDNDKVTGMDGHRGRRGLRESSSGEDVKRDRERKGSYRRRERSGSSSEMEDRKAGKRANRVDIQRRNRGERSHVEEDRGSKKAQKDRRKRSLESESSSDGEMERNDQRGKRGDYRRERGKRESSSEEGNKKRQEESGSTSEEDTDRADRKTEKKGGKDRRRRRQTSSEKEEGSKKRKTRDEGREDEHHRQRNRDRYR